MSTDEIRVSFLDYFSSKQHRIFPSDSLIPQDDPTLLFTSAGMNQFKKFFLNPSSLKRAASCQRCLRTDDLDKVGKTPRHHTFFEMLGNFSFGDYFKLEAIEYAWEYLTKVLKLKESLLWVSVYERDEEAYEIWRKRIGLPQERIVRLGEEENFWPANAIKNGPNGPCGPCSEVFFDQGKEKGCKRPDCKPGCSCFRFIEIWNLVFTQYNRKENSKGEGILEKLPSKNIDTGMGLERIASVLQGVDSNFKIDIFTPLVEKIAEHFKKDTDLAPILRIADHTRAIVFAIADGAYPSNEGRGYVVRKLIRKSVSEGFFLGEKKPFLYLFAPLLIRIMEKSYPYLNQQKDIILRNIFLEEEAFLKTLKSAPGIVEQTAQRFISRDTQLTKEKIGQLLFFLFDTHGIPLDVSVDLLEGYGFKREDLIDNPFFEELKRKQKKASQEKSIFKKEIFSTEPTLEKETEFKGYEKTTLKTRLVKIIKEEGQVSFIEEPDKASFILESTVFYAEAGGQLWDRGIIILPDSQAIFEVEKVISKKGLVLHQGWVKKGRFQLEDMVIAKLDISRRQALKRAHTATHILQSVLREILGTQLRQEGSLVDEDRLRFDFSYPKALDKEKLSLIEAKINERILEDAPVNIKFMSLEEAKKIKALAFFEEKYKNTVRVVSIADYSKELCGGTHVERTSQIGIFSLVEEKALAKGIRRIEALTGRKAYFKAKENTQLLLQILKILNKDKTTIIEYLKAQREYLKELEEKFKKLKLKMLYYEIPNLIKRSKNIKGINLIVFEFKEVMDFSLLRSASDLIKEKIPGSGIIFVYSLLDKKWMAILRFSEDLCKKGWNAKELTQDLTKVIGGGGGGRSYLTQLGGEGFISEEKIKEILAKIIQQKIKKL